MIKNLKKNEINDESKEEDIQDEEGSEDEETKGEKVIKKNLRENRIKIRKLKKYEFIK